MRKYSHMYMALQKQEQGKVQVKFAEYWTLVYVGVNCWKTTCGVLGLAVHSNL